MASRGWEGVTASQLRPARAAKPSKYRNVKVTIDGQRFDSKREADYWLLLKERERRGEIDSLCRQVEFALCAPDRTNQDDQHRRNMLVSSYIADYQFYDQTGNRHVVDAKGKRTAMYQLKKKWLELQDGVIIEEV